MVEPLDQVDIFDEGEIESRRCPFANQIACSWRGDSFKAVLQHCRERHPDGTPSFRYQPPRSDPALD